MAKQKTTSVSSKVKKKWFALYAPESFNKVSLGETLLTDSSLLNEKYITANMSTITGNMRKNSINMQFKVTRVEEGKGYTRTVGYSMINSAVKRLVRRGKDKVSDSFLVKTKDKDVIRVKPLIITSSCTTKSLQSAVRLEARRLVKEHAFSVGTEAFFSDIFSGKLQKKLKEQCSKFYRLKAVEIRIAKLDEQSKVVVTDKKVESNPVKRRKKDVEGKRHIPESEKQELEAKKKESQELDMSSDVDSEDFGEEPATEESEDADDSSKKSSLEEQDEEENSVDSEEETKSDGATSDNESSEETKKD
ncbi:MAG: hypothetical protein ACQESC_04240 [Nanobdellota archaeon]